MRFVSEQMSNYETDRSASIQAFVNAIWVHPIIRNGQVTNEFLPISRTVDSYSNSAERTLSQIYRLFYANAAIGSYYPPWYDIIYSKEGEQPFFPDYAYRRYTCRSMGQQESRIFLASYRPFPLVQDRYEDEQTLNHAATRALNDFKQAYTVDDVVSKNDAMAPAMLLGANGNYHSSILSSIFITQGRNALTHDQEISFRHEMFKYGSIFIVPGTFEAVAVNNTIEKRSLTWFASANTQTRETFLENCTHRQRWSLATSDSPDRLGQVITDCLILQADDSTINLNTVHLSIIAYRHDFVFIIYTENGDNYVLHEIIAHDGHEPYVSTLIHLVVDLSSNRFRPLLRFSATEPPGFVPQPYTDADFATLCHRLYPSILCGTVLSHLPNQPPDWPNILRERLVKLKYSESHSFDPILHLSRTDNKSAALDTHFHIDREQLLHSAGNYANFPHPQTVDLSRHIRKKQPWDRATAAEAYNTPQSHNIFTTLEDIRIGRPYSDPTTRRPLELKQQLISAINFNMQFLATNVFSVKPTDQVPTLITLIFSAWLDFAPDDKRSLLQAMPTEYFGPLYQIARLEPLRFNDVCLIFVGAFQLWLRTPDPPRNFSAEGLVTALIAKLWKCHTIILAEYSTYDGLNPRVTRLRHPSNENSVVPTYVYAQGPLYVVVYNKQTGTYTYYDIGHLRKFQRTPQRPFTAPPLPTL
jgi:hypothetical protein